MSAPLPGLLIPHPENMAAVEKPYGNVLYADPGYNDNKKRYPIDNPRHVRAAWAYINMPRNASKYTPEQLDLIKSRIRAAAKEHGVQIAESGAHAGASAMGMAVPNPGTILAGAAPLAPPASWFSDPGLQGPTKLTITEEGRVFGHLAQWRKCHVGIGNACVMAPRTQTGYSHFKIGAVLCDDGSQVPIGKIVMGTAHANAQWGVMPSRDHYDNTALTAAIVAVGEDKHGIWVNGALTTDMTPEKIASLRASALSGDWRAVNGNLELIAALAVNSPGFPIISNKNGYMFSLQSVGVIGFGEEEAQSSGEEIDMTTFSNGASDAAFATPPTGVEEVDEALSARKSRLQSIEDSHEQLARNKRMAQLAVLDAEREGLADSLPVPRRDTVALRQEWRAKFRQLPEDDIDDETDEEDDELEDLEDEDE